MEMGSAAEATSTQDEVAKQIRADCDYALTLQEWDGNGKAGGGTRRRKRRPSTTSVLDPEGASSGGPAGKAKVSKRQRARARKAVGPEQREAERQRLLEEEEDRKALQKRKGPEEEAKRELNAEVTDAEISQVTDAAAAVADATDAEAADSEVADAEGLARVPAAAAEDWSVLFDGVAVQFRPRGTRFPPIPASWQQGPAAAQQPSPPGARTRRKGARGPASRDPAAAAEGARDPAAAGRVRPRRSRGGPV